MNKIIIEFKELLNNKVITKEFTNISESHAIELLKREYASVGITIISIKDNQEELLKEMYIKNKEIEIEKYKKQIVSIIKKLIKKPYNKNNRKIRKELNIKKDYMEEIKNFVISNYMATNTNNCFLADNKIQINVSDDGILIVPTEEYFLNAD